MHSVVKKKTMVKNGHMKNTSLKTVAFIRNARPRLDVKYRMYNSFILLNGWICLHGVLD